MSYAAIDQDNRLHCLPTAPDDVKEYAKLLTGEEAYALAATRVLRCGQSGCTAPLFYRQGADVTPHFFHASGTAEKCIELTGPAGEWHLKMQYEVFKDAFAHEWSMQSAIADIVIQRKSTNNRFAVEIQHSPTSRETVLARHAAHKAAGLVGTVWIVDGRGIKPGTRIHKSWMIDLIQACQDTPGKYPCTVLIYKDKRAEEKGRETVSIIETAEFGHEADGSRFMQAALKRQKNGEVLRFDMKALGFLAQGRDRDAVVPISVAGLQQILDSLPTRRIGHPAQRFNRWAN